MKLLTRPVRVGGFAGLGDLNFDFGDTTTDVPTTSSGAIDWSQVGLTVPQPPANFSTLALPAGASSSGSLADIGNAIARGAQTLFGTETAVNNAQAAAQLAKAQSQAAINIAKAGGINAAKVAGAGVPSPSLLLVAGLGLAALMLLKK